MSRIAFALATFALLLHLVVLLVSVDTIGTRAPRPVARAAAVPATPQAGLAVIRRAGCASCHALPGPAGRGAAVGPPLHDLRQRRYLAGNLPHTPENLARWIQDPQGVEPGSAMPNLGLSRGEARAVVAYLYHYGGE